MAILVTGAAGFIGYHVSKALLERGERVVGIDDLNPYYDPRLKRDRLDELRNGGSAFQFSQVDFSEHEALDDALAGIEVDRIVHLGAQAGVRHSIENPRAYARSNLAGHLNILELGRQRGVRHLVYASSSSVYGGNRSLPITVEDRVDRPVSLYAATKKADELMSEAYAHLYRLPQTGLRFFTVYGPWGRPDMATWIFTQSIIAGEPIKLFNHGRMRRDFTYIDDVVAGTLACLDAPPAAGGAGEDGRSPHRLYNIGNNRPEELGHLVKLIEAAAGKKAVIENLPMQPGDVVETFADIEDSRRDFGFEPRTDLATGIPIFVRWYRGRYTS